MSKNQALWWTIGWGTLAFICLFINVGCALTFLVPTGLFGWIWYVKYDRDAKAVQNQRMFHPSLAIPQSAAPAKASKGSGDLYVPEPFSSDAH